MTGISERAYWSLAFITSWLFSISLSSEIALEVGLISADTAAVTYLILTINSLNISVVFYLTLS